MLRRLVLSLLFSLLLSVPLLPTPSLAGDPPPDEPREAKPTTRRKAAPADRAKDGRRAVGLPARRTEPAAPGTAPPAREAAPGREADRAQADRTSADRTSADRTSARTAKVPRTVPRAPPPPVHRPYAGRAAVPPVYRTPDHRWARPRAAWLGVSPAARHAPPAWRWYRSWYAHWWVHPWYRWLHATWIVVALDFTPDPWVATWAPPPRAGWVWVPGHAEGPVWVPGHWAPVAPAPLWHGASYVYVPGHWRGAVYFEGFWRLAVRPGWAWIDGRYVGGAWMSGHWVPEAAPPAGYVWEPGFWDGETWVEGYWRPAQRDGYVWVPLQVGADGTIECGYWEPVEARPGEVWVPGWFDGTQWVPGAWVREADYQAADPAAWTPDPGWDAGWTEAEHVADDEAPLALPVDPG